MKGGRLHRLEPQVHLVAATAPAPAPAPAPFPASTDDWVDGSWTVDCSCGVTFDDGEEMVSCDECNVWVHTRCARYVRGVHTFSCHKCRSKRAPSSADEAEVAELLAELSTHRPPQLYRRWAEVPLPSRVHVHGLPGGGDAALFRGAPAFSAALWRCTGYVPKRFGFRYCEFPSWADDKDNGADALFALAREKRRGRTEAVPIVGAEPNEKHYIRSLSCRGKKSDGGQHTAPPLTEAKKREPDTWEDGCLQREGRAMPDAVPGDHYAKTNMVSSDLQAVYTKKKMEESLERSGEKKCPEEIPGMLNQDEQKESLKLEASGIRTTSSVAEQELHSEFVGSEISMYKQQAEGNHNAGLKSGTMNSVHAGPNKMHDLQGLHKLSNQTSNLQDVAGVPNLQIVQSKSHIIKMEPSSRENEIADAVQLVSDGHKSDKQVLGDTAGFSTVQKNASKLTYASACCEHPKSETENPMHTVAEHPNSLSGVAKICKSFSGSISIPCELSHSLVSKEPSSARSTDRLTKKELVSPTDSKHDSAKFSEESSQELTRCSEKVQLKGSLPSAPKSSQASKTYVSTVKPRLPVSKEQSQKTATTGSASARSLHGEVPPLQSRNKAVPSNSSQRKDKVHQRTIHVTQEGSNNSTSAELRASDSTASLSDEQLALLLHQQLNSSPRVPRVPRCHQASGTQMLHQTGASVFSKRSSAHGGRDYGTVLKKRNREDVLKDSEDTKRTEKTSFIERRQRDSSAEHVSSVKDSCRFAENIASEQINRGVCSTGANTGLAQDDLMDSSVSRSLPGLIGEVISKNRNVTYGELCNAIHENFRDLWKPNEEDCSYSSYFNAINDCLRKRGEWAHLIDQAPNTISNKRRKGGSDSLLADVLEADNMRSGPERDSEEGSADLHQEALPRGKRKARKCRRLELKGRRVRDTRKRSSIDSSSEDAAATLSDSSSDRNDTPMDGVNRDDNSVAPRTGGHMEAKSAD
uniref:Zinc finger PHD-type domain-containing protein n=1 Tax=Arundo donax TaxID=35708 RepID=A0A0A9D1C4_ARUDO